MKQPNDSARGGRLSAVPRTVLWVAGAIIVLIPAALWITRAGGADMRYGVLMFWGLVLGLLAIGVGTLAHPGEVRRWLRIGVYGTLWSFIAAVVGIVGHNLAYAATSDEGNPVAVMFFLVAMLGILAFLVFSVMSFAVYLTAHIPRGDGRHHGMRA